MRLTQAVAASFESSADPRFRAILTALVRHLHALAEEVQLTEGEWAAAIDFLTRTGQACDDQRQEFVLLSDVLGLSMKVVEIDHDGSDDVTAATVLGPFYVPESPWHENGDDIARGAPGEPCLVAGRVLSAAGEPIAGASIEVWQADDEGLYDVQRADLDAPQGRGRFRSADDGRYWFWSVKPVPYPIPTDGPVGELLAAARRSEMRPAHVHFRVAAPDHRTLTTHIFVDGDPHLGSDAVFGVRRSLIAQFERHESGVAPDGRTMGRPFWVMTRDMVLAPAKAQDKRGDGNA